MYKQLFFGTLLIGAILLAISYNTAFKHGSDHAGKDFQKTRDSLDRRVDSLVFLNTKNEHTVSQLLQTVSEMKQRDSVLIGDFENLRQKQKRLQKKYDDLKKFDKLTSEEVKDYFKENFSDSTNL